MSRIFIQFHDQEDEPKKDFVSSSDHEQDERDYYDRESEKQLSGCLFSLKALGLITLIYFLYHLFRFIYEHI